MEVSNWSASLLAEDAGNTTSIASWLRSMALNYATTDFSVSECGNGTDPIASAELCQAAASVLGLSYRKSGFMDGRAPGCVVSTSSDVWFNLAGGGVNGENFGLICDVQEPCTANDGNLSAVYPCTCGKAMCQPGQVCNSDTCQDVPCSVADGSYTSDSYPCTCGNVTCATGQICTSSLNECMTFVVRAYGLNDCGPLDTLSAMQCEVAALDRNLTFRSSDSPDGAAQGCIASRDGDAWFNSVAGGVNSDSYAPVCSTRQGPRRGAISESEYTDFAPPPDMGTSTTPAPTSSTVSPSSTQPPSSTTAPTTSSQPAPAAWEFVTSGSCADPVDSLAECAAALAYLNWPGGAINDGGNLADRPSGCYHRTKGDHRRFNAGTNTGQCSAEWKCVCRQTALMLAEGLEGKRSGYQVAIFEECRGDALGGWVVMDDVYRCQQAASLLSIPAVYKFYLYDQSEHYGCIVKWGNQLHFNGYKGGGFDWMSPFPRVCETRGDCNCANGEALQARWPGCALDRACRSCNPGYYLQGGQCIAYVCSCSNGAAAAAGTCPSSGAHVCQSCDRGYRLLGASCVANVCQCRGGTASTGADCKTNGGHYCSSCIPGKHLKQNVPHCTDNVCTCANGVPAYPGQAECYAHGGEICTSCNQGYVLRGTVCQPCLDQLFDTGTYTRAWESIGLVDMCVVFITTRQMCILWK